MKFRIDVRFYAALMSFVLLGTACSSGVNDGVQANYVPKAEDRIQRETVETEAVVMPPAPEKPARKASAVRPAKPAQSPKQEEPVTFVPPAVIEPERPSAVYEPEPQPVQARRVTIPSGTLISVRMVDAISSEENTAGETFRASIDGPVLVHGETVIPKYADAFVKLVAVKTAGELTGRPEVSVQLDRIVIAGKRYTVDSNVFDREGASQTTQTAKSAGIGAAIGAAVGAITGGKKGALIGAGVGAGSGVAVEAATKSEQARLDSETRVDFRLASPLEVTIGDGTSID